MFPFSKIALKYASPLFLTGFRMALAGIMLLGYQYLFKKEHFVFPTGYWKPLLFAAFVNIYVTNVLCYWGAHYVTPTKSCFLYNLYPFAAAFIAYMYLNERLTPYKWLGLCIGFLGTVPLLFTSESGGAMHTGWHFFIPLPELAIVVSIITDPLGWIFIQKAILHNKCNALMANGLTMFFGGIFALFHSASVEGWSPLPIVNYKGFLLSALALMLISNIVGSVVYIKLLQKYSITFLALSSFIEPLLVGIFDWFLFSLTVPKSFYPSFLVVCLGLYVFYKDELAA